MSDDFVTTNCVLSSIDPKIKVRVPKDLLVLPKAVTVKKFNEDAAVQFANDMMAAADTGQDVIPIYINSYGGDVYALLSMVDTINTFRNRHVISTISVGKSMSCGAVLFSQGTEGYRYIANYSTLMIHDVSSWTHGKIEEVKADAKEAERLDDLIFALMAQGAGKPEKYFKDIVHQKGHAEWYLTAQETKEHNLANIIGYPRFKMDVRVNISFEV